MTQSAAQTTSINTFLLILSNFVNNIQLGPPSFGFGPTYNINDSQSVTFPLVWVEPGNFSITQFNQTGGIGYVNQKYNIYCLDRLNTGEPNFQYQNVYSDMAYLMMIIQGYISGTSPNSIWRQYKITIQDGNSEAKPLTEVMNENVSGWVWECQLRMPFTITSCDSPIANSYQIFQPGNTPGNFIIQWPNYVSGGFGTIL